MGSLTRFLLDSHALLWAFNEPDALSRQARTTIEMTEHIVLVSAVSAYELAYKHRIGKLDEASLLLEGFVARLAEQQFDLLALTVDHALLAGGLAWSHKDPFDRLLVAQALADDLTLISNERQFDATGVKRLW